MTHPTRLTLTDDPNLPNPKVMTRPDTLLAL